MLMCLYDMLAVTFPALLQTLGGNRGMGVFRKSLVNKQRRGGGGKGKDSMKHTHGGSCENLYVSSMTLALTIISKMATYYSLSCNEFPARCI